MLHLFLRLAALCVTCLHLTSTSLTLADTHSQPNIVIIIVDDLGWRDVGYNGSEIQTPNIDQLAKDGVRLDRFYAHSSCTPTRASLMTGQTAARIGITSAFYSGSDDHLPLDLIILPEFLADAGYKTSLVGKWHLGHTKKSALPLSRGFDQAYGSLTGGLGYWDHVSGGGYDWHRNEVTSREEGYTTHLIADEAVRVIEAHNQTSPLFLYAAFTAAHLPNEAPKATIDKYAEIDNENRRVHAAMVDELDTGIGKILATLKKQNMADSTVIWFLSDNGGTYGKGRGGMGSFARVIDTVFGKPAPTKLLELLRMVNLDGGSDNGPYKGGKGNVSEGGVLVPAIVSWPGVFPARPVANRITVNDIMPTLLALAGTEPVTAQPIDGANQANFFKAKSQAIDQDYLTINSDKEAYYMGDWKLIRNLENDEQSLYILAEDPYEENDLADQNPEKLAEISEKLEQFPRGERINTSPSILLLRPESWGGKEDSEPWADRLRAH